MLGTCYFCVVCSRPVNDTGIQPQPLPSFQRATDYIEAKNKKNKSTEKTADIHSPLRSTALTRLEQTLSASLPLPCQPNLSSDKQALLAGGSRWDARAHLRNHGARLIFQSPPAVSGPFLASCFPFSLEGDGHH